MIHDSNEWITFRAKAALDEVPEFSEAIPDKFVSDWLELTRATDLTFITNVRGDETAAKLYLERESDHSTLEVPVLQTDRAQDAERIFYTLLGGENSRYRFVLEPSSDKALGVLDVEMVIPESEQAFRKSSNLSRYGGVLNLATMGQTSVLDKVMVYPNPSSDEVSIIFDFRTVPVAQTNVVSNTNLPERATVEIYSAQGVEMCRLQCLAADAVRVNTSAWPVGIYTARIVVQGAAASPRPSVLFTIVR